MLSPEIRGPYSSEIINPAQIDLSGKVAVVTGSSRGIGREIALTLASHKANLILNSTANSLPQIEQVRKEIEKMGQKAIITTGDVSKEQTAKDIVANAIKEFGHIDILINNAGTRRDKLLIQMSLEEWQSILDINLTSAFLVSREVVREMLKNKKGSIVNISSIVATLGNSGQVNYGASKGGLISLGYTIAQEYGGKRGIRANTLALGLVNTELTSDLNEKQREQIAKSTTVLTKKEVAEQVLYLASDKSMPETAKLIIMDGARK